MFRTIVIALALTPLAAHAQGLRPLGDVDVTYLVGSEARLVGSITLTPDTPGDELLWFNAAFGPFVTVMVPHASNSGHGGVFPRPGICVEPSMLLPFPPDKITIADVNGDGLSDVLLEAVNGDQVRHGVMYGERPKFCR